MFSRKDMPVTMLLIGICVTNFIAYMCGWGPEEGWGYYYAEDIWGGSYWAYLTSCFVHCDIIHIGFNMYWLYLLGRVIEKEIGSIKFLLIILFSAVVTSASEFIISADTGVGFSGVLYCFVGLMWGLKRKYPAFGQFLTKQLFGSFLAWLLLCFAMTYLEDWSVGNAAHLSGLFLGLLLAKLFTPDRYRGWWIATHGLLLVISIAPLFWFPSSNQWVCYKAYDAYENEQYKKAVEWLTKAIQMDPMDAWAYNLRGCAYAELDQFDLSTIDWKKAHELDPSYEEIDWSDG